MGWFWSIHDLLVLVIAVIVTFSGLYYSIVNQIFGDED